MFYGLSLRTGRLRVEALTAGMDEADAKRLKQLEEVNRRLKKLVADQALDNAMLEVVLSREW